MKAKKKTTFLEVLDVLGGESDPDLVNLLLGFFHTLLLRRLHCVRHLYELKGKFGKEDRFKVSRVVIR